MKRTPNRQADSDWITALPLICILAGGVLFNIGAPVIGAALMYIPLIWIIGVVIERSVIELGQRDPFQDRERSEREIHHHHVQFIERTPRSRRVAEGVQIRLPSGIQITRVRQEACDGDSGF